VSQSRMAEDIESVLAAILAGEVDALPHLRDAVPRQDDRSGEHVC